MLQTKFRISLTFNNKQLIDAQILAAFDAVGGDISDLLKLFALRGIMTDPALSACIAHGAAKTVEARKSIGTGFDTKKILVQKADIISTPELISNTNPVVSESALHLVDAVCEQSSVLPDVEAAAFQVSATALLNFDIPQATVDSTPYVSPVTESPVDDYSDFIFNNDIA